MTTQMLSDAGKAVEELLPFYAAGVLSNAEMGEVERVLAADAELRRRLVLVEEEQTEAILLNEGIAGPSTHALEKLMTAIDAEPRQAAVLSGKVSGITARIGQWLQALSPRQATWGMAIAALLLTLQAGALVGLMLDRQDGGFQTASQATVPAPSRGMPFTVIFQPDAKASEINGLLERLGARVVDGPKAGGIYRIEVGQQRVDAAAGAVMTERLRAETTLIRLVSPAP